MERDDLLRIGDERSLQRLMSAAATIRVHPLCANRHALAAQAAGLKVSLLDDTAFERDIDTPEDLQWLRSQDNSSDTVRFLQESELATQLNDMIEAAATA